MQKSLKSFISYAWGSKELRIAMYILFTAIFFVVFELTPLMDWLRQSLVSFSVSITIVVAITVMSFFLNYLFHNEDLKVAMEKMEKVIETINMGWLLPESVVLEKESKADEIWVFQTNLEKEYDTQPGEVGEAVLNNLKSGKKYTYFLPTRSFTNGQVETFKRIFNQKELEYQVKCESKNKKSVKFSYKFVLVEDDSIFIHSEIVLYNPTIPVSRDPNRSDDERVKERNAIEFLPSDEKTTINTRYYIDLNDQRANEIWSLGCKLIDKVGYDDKRKKAEVNTSLFMLESKLLKIESKAEEIWILKNGLGYDIEKDHPIQKLVEENLKKDEFKYKYFLLNDSDGGNLKDKAIFEKMYDKYDENFEFIMVPDNGLGLFVHSEIAIYNPTSVGKRQAIEWIPTERQCTLEEQEESLEKQEGQEYSQIYIDLGIGSERTNEVYKICKKLKKNYGEK
jgi:low affinity Fe/Cu permease